MSREGQSYYDEGLSLEKAGDVAKAFEAFRRSAKADPRVAAPYLGLARLLTRNHQRKDAIACLERAVACEPKNLTIKTTLGRTFAEDGQLEAARTTFVATLRDAPHAPEGLLGLGAVYEDLGDRAAAADTYRRLLAAHPNHAEGLAGLLGVADGAALADVMRAAQTHAQTAGDRDAAMIGYALGKALARGGDTDAVFEAWVSANAARRREAGPFDRAAFDRRIDRLCEIFNRDFMAARRDWGASSERPVFVVGLPRSGTTLTEHVLAAHPHVYGAGELDVLTDLATGLPDRLGQAGPPWPDAVEAMTRAQADDVGRGYLERLAQIAPENAARVIDKQPLNFWHLGFIALALPQARIIHCRRDLRDGGLSIFSENFAPQQRWATDLDDIAYYWRGYRRLMDHWTQVLSLPVLDIDYEDMVADLEGQARRLLAFAGLAWDETVLNFYEADRAVQTPSRWQVRRPLYKTSRGRWRSYAAHLQPLIVAAEGTAR